MAATTYRVEVLEFQSEKEAEAGTTSELIVITGHELGALDMIVNSDAIYTDLYGNAGSRQVYDDGLTEDNIPLNTKIVGQSNGNDIRLYKYIDRSGLIRPGTFKLTRKAKGQSVLDFEIITTSAYLLRHGQNVRVAAVSGSTTYAFWGCVDTHTEELIGAAQTVIRQTVSCQGATSIAARRTIELNQAAGVTYGSIVQKMVDEYLVGEGVRIATIDAGATLQDEWISDCISIKEVLDECADKSGFSWWVTDEGQISFTEEVTTPAAAHTLDSSYENYTNLKFSTATTEYCNRVFFAGASDGVEYVISQSLDDEILAQRENNAGTGVFGMVIRDTTADSTERTAEPSSTTSTIYITGHGVYVGDVVWNRTRDEYSTVATTPNADRFTVSPAFSDMTPRAAHEAEVGTTTENITITGHGVLAGDRVYNATRATYRTVLFVVDADNFRVEALAGQVATDSIETKGDIISLLPDANKQISSMLKKQGIAPTTVTFKTPDKFLPDTKLHIDLPDIGQDDCYFLIEDVVVVDIGRGLSECWYEVKGTKRNNASFSSQRKITYADYWRNF